MGNLLQDLRYGLRTLARSPGFTAVAVLTLVLGIGSTSAIFSVVYGVLLRPLPYPKPEQIVSVSELNGAFAMNFVDPNFDDLREANHSLIGMAAYQNGIGTVVVGSEPARVGAASVSRDFLRVMGVGPILARGFVTEEQHMGAAPAALVSYGYWRQHLGGTAELSTVKLKMDNKIYFVVGVLPPGFSFPGDSQIWIPREGFEHLPSRTAHNWHVVARLRDGVTLATARTELSALARRLKQQFGAYIDMTDARVVPLRESLTGNVRSALLILLGAVGFLLLVGCVNVANLLLARAVARERELAIRVALGAGRGRLIRQFLAESFIVALAGGALSVLAALWGVNALMALAPPNLPRLGEVSINGPVLAFVLGVSVLVAVGLGMLTALRATSDDPRSALGEGNRGQAGSVRSQRLGRVLVAAQLAITLVLLTGAGLLGRSLLRVLSIDPGFKTEHIVTMEIEIPSPATPSDAARPINFVSTLFERLRAIPGVHEVGGSSDLPLAGDISDGTFLLLDRQPALTGMEALERLFHTAPTGYAGYCRASEGYFKALGIPLLRGRLFSQRDTADAPHVALISESVARATWPNQDPLGKTIEFGNMDGDLRLLTVVGVVGDVRERSLETPPRPIVYVNYRQRLQGGRDFTVVLQSAGDTGAMLAAARKIVRDLDPDVVPRFRAFQEVIATSLETRRFNLSLIGVFAATALLLATIGIYGVMAYGVARRTREIGVRIALGASVGDVLRLVLAQGMTTVAAGIAIGIIGSIALTRTMQSLLFGVTPTDPATLACVALLLAVVALLASYIPARRAVKQIQNHLDNLFELAAEQRVGELLNGPKYQDSRKLNRYEHKVFSQSGEDGIIAEIFRRIGTTNKVFVEAAPGNGLENNTVYLLILGWKGLWVEASPRHVKAISERFTKRIRDGNLRLEHELITAENIEGILSKASIPADFDLLSIDIDRNDYWVWKAIREHRPRIVVIEYNAIFPPGYEWVVEYDPRAGWDATSNFGASLKSMEILGSQKGYKLIGCTLAGTNAFFVREDLAGDAFSDPFTAENHYEPPRYYLVGRKFGHQRSPR